MKRVLIESPFAGEVDKNQMYARFCSHYCVTQLGEAPYASHLYYTQEFILNDDKPEERLLGIDAGLVWGEAAQRTAVFVDLGITDGMCYGVMNAWDVERPVIFRNLPPAMWEAFKWQCIQREYMVPIDPEFDASSPGSDARLTIYVQERFEEMMEKKGIV